MEEKNCLLIITCAQDDEQSIRKILRQTDFELEYFWAKTTDEIKQSLKLKQWDLVLANLDKSLYDGFSVSEIIHRNNSGAPIILMGEDVPEETVMQAFKAGACDYIEKSKIHRLVPVINRELNHARIKRKHKKTNIEQEYLSHIFRYNPYEIYLFDASSLKFINVNQEALDNTKYSEREIYNLTPLSLYANHTKNSFSNLLHPLKEGEQTKVSICLWQQRKDASNYPVEVHIQYANQEQTLFVAVTSDLTQPKNNTSSINQWKKLVEKYAERSRKTSNFLADISHDLRTNLNSIILLSDSLIHYDDGKLDQRQLEYIKSIYYSSTDLLEFVDEVVDLSKVKSDDNQRLQLTEVNIESVCKKLERIFLPIAEKNNISFTYNIQGPPGQIVKTDRYCLERILKNLLSNAFKFTQEGSIILSVYSPGLSELKEINGDTNSIAFQVTDTGIGIPQANQQLIFNRFQQADDSIQQKYGGAGLGLAISQKLTETLDGKLKLKSKIGEGSTFTLYLPANNYYSINKNDDTQNRSIKPIPAANTNSRQLNGTVLLVDDSQIHNLALKEFLSYKICHCITAGSAKQLYNTLEKNHIDCLILDMSLPDARGYEIITYLKAQKDYKNIPIIIYTGKNLSQKEKQKINKLTHSIVPKKVDSYKILEDKIISILS